MAPESNGQGGVGNGVSETDEAKGVSLSINLEFVFSEKQNQNLAVWGKRGVIGYRSSSAPPTVNGSLRAVGSLLCNSAQREFKDRVPNSDYSSTFNVSENKVQALSANSNNNDCGTLASIIREEYQTVTQTIYDCECQSLFSILPGYPFRQPEEKSRESLRERLKHPASTKPDNSVNGSARILNEGHEANCDLLQEDHELLIKSSASSYPFHHASQSFSDQLPTSREAHGTIPNPNASDAHEYLWRGKTPIPLVDSQVCCKPHSATIDISDIGVPLSCIWEGQVRKNMNESEKQAGSFLNINGPINGYESDPTISGISRPAAHPNKISCLSDLYPGRKSSDFPPAEDLDSYLDSKIQRVDLFGNADSMYNNLYLGETLDTDIEIINIPARLQFQSEEPQMAYLHKNVAAAGRSVLPLRNDFRFGITPRDFIELQKAYLEQALQAQRIQQNESYLSNFSNKYQLNPSHNLGLHYRENSMINASKNHAFHNRRFSQFRNGSWNSDVSAKSAGRLQTPFLEGLKISKVQFFGLQDIIGHVVEFSMDQCGSRLIQKKLETASEIDKNLIFPEISLHARELMTDVFGNYVIQKFLECGTTSQRRELVDQLSGCVMAFSLDKYGCRVIQKALDVVDVDQISKIVTELSGAVIKCVHDHNGNHVIQKCIESIPEELIQPIIVTLYGHVAALSTHTYGCRVIQRVLEYCVDQKTRKIVFNEILESVVMLTQNQYGNYVVQRLLLYGKADERSAIIRKLVGQVVNLSCQKFASNVIEMCLEHCTKKDRHILVNEILRPTGEVEPLQVMMLDQYGNYVVQRILKTCTDKDLGPILSRIKVHLKSLKKYTYGKNIVFRIEKRVMTGERRIELSSLYQ